MGLGPNTVKKDYTINRLFTDIQVAPGLHRSSSVTSSMSCRSIGRAESVVGGGYMSDATEAVLASSLEEQLGSLAELRQQQLARDLAARRQQLTKRGSIMSNYIGLPVPGRRSEAVFMMTVYSETLLVINWETTSSISGSHSLKCEIQKRNCSLYRIIVGGHMICLRVKTEHTFLLPNEVHFYYKAAA